MSRPPTIIIGAPRSGTNMLRDVLVQLPELGTWPCDELNYLWRHGNARHPTDELTAEHATPAVRRYVRRAFERLRSRRGLSRALEKTCANSLRIPFVDRIFPQARYVLIVRDGRAATASAMLRWKAPLDLPYILRKTRYVPRSDVPYYAVRYLFNRVHRLFSAQKRLATWGPRFEGMEEILRQQGMAAVCAAQWARCVSRAEEDLGKIAPERVFRVRYEDFVTRPAEGLRAIAEFHELDLSSSAAQDMARGVTNRYLDGWRRQLSDGDRERIEPIMASLLVAHGYR